MLKTESNLLLVTQVGSLPSAASYTATQTQAVLSQILNHKETSTTRFWAGAKETRLLLSNTQRAVLRQRTARCADRNV